MTKEALSPLGISLLRIDRVWPNNYNANIMDDEKFASLLEDFKQQRPVEPIIVRDMKDQYEIIDGFHRWKAARQAGLALIKAEIRTMTDDEARVYNYKVNRVRGTIDPIKEARLFASELQKGLTQEQVAAKYGISQQQVSERIRLLDIDDVELQAFQAVMTPTPTPTPSPNQSSNVDNTKGDERDFTTRVVKSIYRPTASQLEVLASVPKPVRENFLLEAQKQTKLFGEPPSVKVLDRIAEQVKEDYEKKKDLSKALEQANFKTCPICGQPPVERVFVFDNSVRCAAWHAWDLGTGKDPLGSRKGESTKQGEEEKPSAVFRLKAEKEVLEGLLVNRVRALFPKLEGFMEFSVAGFPRGSLERSYQIVLEIGEDQVTYLEDLGAGGKRVQFSIERKDYKTGERTKVNCGSPDKVPEVQKFLQELSSQALQDEKPIRSMAEQSLRQALLDPEEGETLTGPLDEEPEDKGFDVDESEEEEA